MQDRHVYMYRSRIPHFSEKIILIDARAHGDGDDSANRSYVFAVVELTGGGGGKTTVLRFHLTGGGGAPTANDHERMSTAVEREVGFRV